MSKAIIIKGIDASSSPLGQITFVAPEVDLTSQIKWMGLVGGQQKFRIFTTAKGTTTGSLVPATVDATLQYNLGGSVGFVDVTDYQGSTLELNSYPYNSGDNRYFHICFADAVSDNGTKPITDEGLEIIPMSKAEHANAIHTIAIYRDAESSTTTRRSIQLTVPTVASGNVYFIFTNASTETEFSGYVKILAG